MNFDSILSSISGYINFVSIVSSLTILIFGYLAIKFVMKVVRTAILKMQIDLAVQKFLISLIEIALKILLLLTVASNLGIPTTSFIAAIGAATFAIGLALRDSLSNLASGIMIIFLKPFKINDFIETNGISGSVISIKLFNTVVLTPDNRRVTMPNSSVFHSNIINFTAEEIRRIDFIVGVSYDDDIKKVKDVLQQIADEEHRILREKDIRIGVLELADSSVNFAFRVWCRTEDFWNVRFDMLEQIKLKLDEAEITIPYPQRDVHLFNN